MYKAEHYTRINGVKYKPGDYIYDEIPPEKLERLLGEKAVRIVTAPSPDPVQEEPESAEIVKDEFSTGVPEPQEETEEPEELEEDAPEIDVMAGIVQEEEEEPKKPARTRKTAERRKKS